MSGPARLPALPQPGLSERELLEFLGKLREIVEVREGRRGDDLEKVVTWRDLAGLGIDLRSLRDTSGRIRQPLTFDNPNFAAGAPGGRGMLPPSRWSPQDIDAFSEAIRNSKLYRDLQYSLSDPARFDFLPEEVRKIVAVDLLEEAKRRGADISRLEQIIQSRDKSMALTAETLTAAVAGAQAAVREVSFAWTSADQALAGRITTLTAALDGVGSSTFEEAATVIANRTTGLIAQYMLKLNAGKAVAGFGLLASEDPEGNTTSEFIIQADKFALTSGYTYAQSTAPNATQAGETWYDTDIGQAYYATAPGTNNWSPYNPLVPFGVDTVTGTVYINGNIRINSGGTLLNDLAAGEANYLLDLSNEAFTVATNYDGSGGSYGVNTETEVKVYAGQADDTVNWTFSITTTNCTATINGGAGPVSGTGLVTVRITNLTADTGFVTILAEKTDAPDLVADFTGSKAKAGADGTPATIYYVSSSVAAVSKTKAGAYVPTSVTFSSYSRTGTDDPAAYSGRFKIATSTDGVNFSDQYTSGADESSKAYTVPSNITHIRVRLYKAGGTTVLVDQETVPIVTDGSDGTPGSNGLNGYAVALSSGAYPLVVPYDSAGNRIAEALAYIDITATPYNCQDVPYYEFILDGSTVQGPNTTATYRYDKKATYGQMPDVLKVNLRDGSAGGTIVATDQVSIIGTKLGGGGISIVLSNEAHTLPTTNGGVVTYTGSGTNFWVYEGNELLTFDAEDSNYPGTNGRYSVAKSASGIQAGTISGAGTTTGTIGVHNSMSADTATVTLTFRIRSKDGTAVTATSKQQSLAKSWQGSNGTNGARGTVHISKSIAGSTWSDSEANSAISTAGYGSPVERDMVTLYNTSAKYSEQRYYSGGSWLSISLYLSGNAFIDGTLAATKLTTGSFTSTGAHATIRFNETPTNASGTIPFAVDRASSTDRPVAWFTDNGTGAPVVNSALVELWSRGAALKINSYGLAGDASSAAHYPLDVAGTGAYGIAVSGNWRYTGLYAYNQYSGGDGIQGSSASGYGAKLTGNSTKAPLLLVASGSKPSDATTGSLMVYNDGNGWRLCVGIGGTWYKIEATYTAI